MKKVFRTIMTFFVVCIVIVVSNFFIKGVPLFGVPDAENVEQIVVKHNDYPDEVKAYTDKNKIEVAIALLGYLNYAPLKNLTDDNQLIEITYIMNDGTELIVSANNHTVWWKGKPRAICEEGMFAKMCTAVFFLQN